MPPLAAIALITIVCGVIALVIYQTQQRHKRRRRGPFQVPRAFVASLQLAFDWRERAAVQGALERLASAAGDDLRSRAGLDRVLDLTLMSLERRSDAIRLAAWSMESLEGLPACEERFRALAAAERSRYQVEVVRGEAGGATRDDGAFVARAEEGRGFVVVTVLVASRKKPPPAELHLDRTGLATAFRELIANTGKTILALEVVWTPAAEQDRMSSAEMQVLFPHLRAVDTLASAAGLPELGRVTCSYCTAVFAAELGECPQCGAALSPPGTGAVGPGR
jgi:uncharacterized membrane protein